jgi:uncharacterized protein
VDQGHARSKSVNQSILLTGATGFVGSAVSARLAASGCRVLALRRTSSDAEAAPTWNPARRQINLAPSQPLDAVVHLAGENIAQRWTPAAQERIRASRVDATRLLCEALSQLAQRPRVLVCASATGYYGDRADEVLDERSGPGAGFLAEVCQAWEAAAAPASQCGIRVVHLRLGVVLARHGGALAKMLPVFRLGLGGRLGGGRQYWSWIALEDVVRVVEFALQEDALTGPVNTVSPEAVTNTRFTRALARALRRPAFLSVPAFAVKALFGQMGREAMLASARVRPGRLLERGFQFHFPDLDTALQSILAPGK